MKIQKALLILILAIAASACGKVPKGYNGDFVDATTGAKLTLKGSEGSLATSDGRVIEAKAQTLDFEALIEGKPGIYLRPLADDDSRMEVFWIFPQLETRKQEYDFVWVQAELLYSRFNAKQEEKVQQFKMIHCRDGMILLDLPTKTWNGGCPAGTIEYDFVRKE
ncbi:MAG: hypothetical protein NDJ90_09910 [Oligoflexia bacterium]|nr:hypothetical protein [Oligoflexia bacterium]